jgi:hypothetical protein
MSLSGAFTCNVCNVRRPAAAEDSGRLNRRALSPNFAGGPRDECEHLIDSARVATSCASRRRPTDVRSNGRGEVRRDVGEAGNELADRHGWALQVGRLLPKNID